MEEVAAVDGPTRIAEPASRALELLDQMAREFMCVFLTAFFKCGVGGKLKIILLEIIITLKNEIEKLLGPQNTEFGQIPPQIKISYSQLMPRIKILENRFVYVSILQYLQIYSRQYYRKLDY